MSKSAELKGMTFDEIAARHGTEAAINAGIAADPEWGPEELDMSDARPVAETLPDLVQRHRSARGKQKTPTKTQTTIRLDTDLVDHFRADGRGWQTRLNDTLRRAVFGE